jgi:hypothetical protein
LSFTESLFKNGFVGIAVPPRIEQAVIADVLDALHGTIQETQAIIAKLRAVKQGLLHALLTIRDQDGHVAAEAVGSTISFASQGGH